MASKKTWIWIIVGVIATCVLALFVLAGAGMYFVSRHISATRTTTADALDAFDRARAPFHDARPLLEIDDLDHTRAMQPTSDLPTSAMKPDQMWVLAWNPNEDPPRIVKVSMPFWLLRFGHRKFDIRGDQHFDFDQLHIDVNELERIGPALVLDYRRSSGERVMIWTQ
jgi:hypothetical protein